jgi:fibronectin type 3 domain-containing protein
LASARRDAPRAAASRSIAVATLVVVAVLTLAACGRKGPPVAPGVRLPRPVTDLSGFVEEDGSIHFGWTNPTRRMDNARLRDLATARVFRTDDDGTGELRPAIVHRGRINGYTELLTIHFPVHTRSSAPPPPAPPLPLGVVIDGTHVRVTDTRGITPRRRYSYVVIVEDSVGRESLPSSRLSIQTLAPAEPPTALAARAGEGEVTLTWQPPTQLTGGDPVTGMLTYEVLRATDPDGTLSPIASSVTDATFTDRGAANDHTYAYAVRTVRADRGTTVRGHASDRITATPRDVTPPSPPRNLVGIPSRGLVRLRWDPSPDAGVVRYVIYRGAEGGEFTREGSVTPPVTAFIDQNLAPGTYRYVVTAQDAAATPNESARSNEIVVRVP